MGYVFEELIRKFNEDNNEEAGEHFTPREVIDLMTHIVFDSIKNNLPPVMTIYDPACGSGGMLTESQNFIKDEEGEIKATGDVILYGKEINDETYAICKSDMMIKGNNPENIKNGSTLSIDDFAGIKFDFMLSNPPYGKSWASEQKYIKDGKDVIDSRFIVNLSDYWGNKSVVGATPRSSDGQLLFLMEMVGKMKPASSNNIGSRIASVHNGSSLFTGDAGSGESNIRRYIIENDLLDAIIQLPNNLFYNTGITTYIWLLSNNKAYNRSGKVQLIDASDLYSKLRKNLGDKNRELEPKHISKIMEIYSKFENTDDEIDGKKISSKVFNNSDFGYYKVNIERPKITLGTSEKNITAQKVIKKISKISGDKLNKLCDYLGCKESELSNFGYYPTGKKDEFVEYESDAELRDSENIALKDDIYQYFLKEVKPHTEEAWINLGSTKIGYEISFNKYFYTHKPLRSLEEVAKDILELENASEGLIKDILGI